MGSKILREVIVHLFGGITLIPILMMEKYLSEQMDEDCKVEKEHEEQKPLV